MPGCRVTASLKIADSLDMKADKVEGFKLMSSILFAVHDIVGAEKYLDSTKSIENMLTGEEVQNKTLLLEKDLKHKKKNHKSSYNNHNSVKKIHLTIYLPPVPLLYF